MPKPVYRKDLVKPKKKKTVKKTVIKKVAKKKKAKVVCVACGGTGINSKGGDCVPCLQRKQYMK